MAPDVLGLQSKAVLRFWGYSRTYLRSVHEQKALATSASTNKDQRSQLIPPSPSPAMGERGGKGSPRFSSEEIKWDQIIYGPGIQE